MKPVKFILSVSMVICIFFTVTTDSHAAWSDIFKIFTDDSNEATSSLSDGEIVNGLKEALSKGTRSAVNNLGRHDGFFKNPRVKIPMPESLEKVEKTLRKFKQDKTADEFIMSMNRAAEQAVPEAASIFSNAIRNMSFSDAKGILQGPDDAATQYFRRSSMTRLTEKMLPIVKKSTNAVGITAKYKNMVDRLGPVSGLVDTKSLDIDQYVTDKALDGLFKILADEEKLIRNDPAARTTALLKKVFGT
jgi:hypothetical protein